MKKYKVIAQDTRFPYIIVEAKNKGEAWEKGKDADGGDFEPNEYDGWWDIIDVEEIE